MSTWSLVSSGWEHVKRIMHHCISNGNFWTLPPTPAISETISGQGQRPGWMGGWQLCSVVWWRGMVVRQLFTSPFFPPFFLIVAHFVRYANCGNVRPTGLHLRTRRRRTKRSHQSKNIVYYSGGSRGNTYNSWAEAKFILVPKKWTLYHLYAIQCNVRYHTLIIGSNIMWCVKNREVFSVN